MRMRTIDTAARHFREIDPETAITQYAIRQAVITGVVPSVRAGAKYLVAIENLETYFSGETLPAAPVEQHGKIRAVV